MHLGGYGGPLLNYIVFSDFSTDAMKLTLSNLLSRGAKVTCSEVNNMILSLIAKPDERYVDVIDSLLMVFPGVVEFANEFLFASCKCLNLQAATLFIGIGAQPKTQKSTPILHVVLTSIFSLRASISASTEGNDENRCIRLKAQFLLTTHKYCSLVRLLINAGADAKKQDSNGLTAVQLGQKLQFVADVVDAINRVSVVDVRQSLLPGDTKTMGRYRQPETFRETMTSNIRRIFIKDMLSQGGGAMTANGLGSSFNTNIETQPCQEEEIW